jgi:hypothetical protein
MREEREDGRWKMEKAARNTRKKQIEDENAEEDEDETTERKRERKRMI